MKHEKFRSYLNESILLINQAIEISLGEWVATIKDTIPLFHPFAETFAKACAGGKRIRGTLVRLGYDVAAREKCANILNAAVACELFQTAILTHDDVIDKSLTRRGRPTVYQALGGDHHAISQAICLGDVGFYRAFQLVTELDCSHATKASALRIVSTMMLNTAIGESMDIELSNSKDKTREKEALMMFVLKTAWYTVIGPLQLGAVVGGASQEALQVIARFGTSLGIAFQIQDDILGVFGDESVLGKPATSDIAEGKTTLLISHALQHASSEDQAYLQREYGTGQLSDEVVAQIRSIFRKTGALDYARVQAREYASEARGMIPLISSEGGNQAILDGVVNYLVDWTQAEGPQ